MADAQAADRTVVVTGAGGLIGSAVSVGLAADGYNVAVVDIDEPASRACSSAIERDGGWARPFVADVSDAHAVEALFADIDRQMPPISGVVTCAAPLALLAKERPLADADVTVWDEIVRVALRGTMLAMRAGTRAMLPRGDGAIVAVSSIHADAGDSTLVAYPAAKAAIVALARSVATQYGRNGIRCNVVSPGTIAGTDVDPAAIERRLRHQVLDRRGQADDVANAIRFLISDRAAFITGQVLTVDGGVLMHLPSYADGGNVIKPEADKPTGTSA
jgi:NAD(P)-dependent dehydrogenase (short-subunit alcohol dehydrogenase family)